MGNNWLIAVLLFVLSCAAFGQGQTAPQEQQEPVIAVEDRPARAEITTTAEEVSEPDGKPIADRAGSSENRPSDALPPAAAKETVSNMRPVDYRRPDARKRFDRYMSNIVGPGTLLQYVGTTALLTLRNTPKEWGTKPEGMARRLANTVAKNVIKESVIYGLDEALKVDSTFYLSRDRSVAARLRNSVFSAVTARNRRGHRVIGIPRLAGSFASGVIASTQWYPNRYDQDHGLKGGAIAIGVTAGVNLFREFVLKR